MRADRRGIGHAVRRARLPVELSEGFSPRELVRKGEKPNAVRNRIHRMRLKFNAFTTAHMVTIAFKEGILK